MSDKVSIAVVGAGLVGMRHIAAIKTCSETRLAAVVEPNLLPKKQSDIGAPCYASLEEMFAHVTPDGVVLSTPSPMHYDGALMCIHHGCPVLVEKPMTVSVAQSWELVETAAKAGIPLLVGHHRRHNPLIQEAAKLITKGVLGDVRTCQTTCWFYKPDDYFDQAVWRKKNGAGPISVNLVHDVDLMRYFCGEVVGVQAQTTPSVRGFENEDLAAAILRFKNGAIGTVTVSDSVVAPWSWELTAQEYPIYPVTSESCYRIAGSQGALSIPDMVLWRHTEKKSWWEPISSTLVAHDTSDPLLNQIAHFTAVIRNEAEPIVSGEEGAKTMQVIEAIQDAAQTNEYVPIVPFDPILDTAMG